MRPSLPHSVRLALVGAPVLLFALAGCDDDPVSFAGVAGEYHLELYQGEPLPAVVGVVDVESTTPGGPSYACEQRVVGAELKLNLDGTFTRETDRVLVCDQDRPDETTHVSERGSYTVGDDGLRLAFEVPAGAAYSAYAELAHRTVDALVVYRSERTTSTGTAVSPSEFVCRLDD